MDSFNVQLYAMLILPDIFFNGITHGERLSGHQYTFVFSKTEANTIKNRRILLFYTQFDVIVA